MGHTLRSGDTPVALVSKGATLMGTVHPQLVMRRLTRAIDAQPPALVGTTPPEAREQLRHALAEVGGAVIAAMSTLHTADPAEAAELAKKMRLLRAALDDAEHLHRVIHRP